MAVRGPLAAESGLCKALTPCPGLAHGVSHERSPRHLLHLPRDYELAIRWLRPSFLHTEIMGRPAGAGTDGISMELQLYDTLSKEKRTFVPLNADDVRMYVCGPTVYDFAHIGNARPVIVFDLLFRLLRHLYGAAHVTYVRNITDVDDKINARAAEEFPNLPLNEAIRKVTEQTDRQFHEDVSALGCLRPTAEPRATEHIAEMRTLVERLVKSGNAYVAE